MDEAFAKLPPGTLEALPAGEAKLGASRRAPGGRLWVPELASVRRPRVHTPWAFDPAERRRIDYCEPVVTRSRGCA